MRDQLMALRVFVHLARTGSFSRAAHELGVSQGTASRMIAALEQRLNATLVARSTRAVLLTEQGRRYLAEVEPILSALDRVDEDIGEASQLGGTLRIGLSASTAINQVIPHLSAFIASHPELTVTLVTDDRRQDLILEQVDVALRFGRLPDSSMRARRLGSWPLVIAAAPAYLKAQPPIREPVDLAGHDFIVGGPIVGRTIFLTKGDQSHAFEVKGKLSATSSEVAVAAVRAGLGLGAGSTSALGGELASGSLVRVLPEWRIGDLEAHALFPGTQAPQRAASAFVDFLVTVLRQQT
jgi:DNA-binding transcriptional LysR family regulator